ncbi:MAG: CNNM domain-containing protein [Candidatus Saccharibacteria bacterium]
MARLVKSSIIIPALWIAFFTFIAGLVLGLGLETFIATVENTLLSSCALVVVILLGIVTDAIGTAATAADIVPFNSMAAKKVPGAREAVKIVSNADLVANVTADVGGDIAGTLSGAIGASIVYAIGRKFELHDIVLLGAAMTSLIAALTVGGKTIGKSLAITYADDIVFRVAKVLRWWESLTGIELFTGRR